MSNTTDPRSAGAEFPDPPAAADEQRFADDAPDDAPDDTFDEAGFRPDDGFGPVPLRYRHDGWGPDRQRAFIEALADCGCVGQAARAVGMSRASAYALRRRPDAQAFRLAWDAALDVAIGQLSDAALARAIHGVALPVFHNGEQVGERRHFDERLTMFLLRYRDPVRYGRWHDRLEARQHPEGPVAILGFRIGRMLRAAWAAFDAALRGEPSPEPEPEVVVGDGDFGDRLGGTRH